MSRSDRNDPEDLRGKAAELGSLDLFARLDHGGSASLSEEARISDVLHRVREGLARSLAMPSRVHGWHTERMFGEVVRALQTCKLVKSEDHGGALGADVVAPDYRVALPSGENLLIEVKNHYEPKPEKPLALTADYVDRLSRYAALANGTLKIAVYWAFQGMWTLLDVTAFTSRGPRLVIDFPTAFAENDMGSVGDMMIASVPPISIRMTIEEDVSTFERQEDGTLKGSVRIKGASLEANGQPLTHDDADLAWYLLMFSDWQEERRAAFDGDLLREIILDFSPTEWDPDQGFASLGFLSQLFSRHYWLSTTKEGQVDRLHVDLDPSTAGFKLAREHHGGLPLWRFVIVPRSRPTTSRASPP